MAYLTKNRVKIEMILFDLNYSHSLKETLSQDHPKAERCENPAVYFRGTVFSQKGRTKPL